MVRRNSKDAQNPLDNIADAAPAFDKKAAAAIPATLTTEQFVNLIIHFGYLARARLTGNSGFLIWPMGIIRQEITA